jgi:cell division protein FtsB
MPLLNSIVIYLKQRKLMLCLWVFIIGLQIPAWFIKGGWLSVWQQQEELAQLKQAVAEQQLSNAQLKADVDELSDQGRGQAAIEERARYKLGMLKTDEIFIQFVQK